MSRLRDKVILITGAAGGIGSAIATAIAREGGRAVTTDMAGKPGMDHALRRLIGIGDEVQGTGLRAHLFRRQPAEAGHDLGLRDRTQQGRDLCRAACVDRGAHCGRCSNRARSAGESRTVMRIRSSASSRRTTSPCS